MQLVRQLGAEMEQTRMGRSLVTKASNGGIEVQGYTPVAFISDPTHPDRKAAHLRHMALIYGFQTQKGVRKYFL